MTARLSRAARQRALDGMAGTELDVLVVGGGVLGAGTALDVVSRGLRVGLVEARDWAAGTSSRSSKLIHGGVHRLEHLEFGLVREALRERSLLLDRLAPHLVRRVPFLYPLHGHGLERAYVAAGLLLYDGLARFPGQPQVLPPHRHLARRRVSHLVPSLRLDGVTGAVQYYDAQTDDARFVLTLVRTAAAYGAHVANRAAVTALLRDRERVVGVRVRDDLTRAEYEIRARVVVAAAGVWTGRLLEEVEAAPPALQFGVAKGVHLVVPRDRIHSSSGLISRTPSSILFFIPWRRHWIIGSTDTAWRWDLERPVASARDIEYLLEQANRQLVSPLTEDDIVGCYAGLRPVLPGSSGPRSSGSSKASQRSGERVVDSPVPGLVVVAGGTLSTYRVLAAAAGDAAAAEIGGLVEPSVTHRLPLLGAEGYHARWNQRHLLARQSGLHVARVEHLLQRYGSMAEELLEMIIADPSAGRPVPAAEDYLTAELRYAASQEGALHLIDILSRRTRIRFETRDRGVLAADYAAGVVGEILGWDQAAQHAQVRTYVRHVQAERLSELQRDDTSAVSALKSSLPERGRMP